MIEPIVYFGIGFLVAALLGLLFVPLVHKRAVRRMVRRLEAASPLSIAEIRADKDQLRAEFTTLTRQLEMNAEQLTTEITTQLAELGEKTDAINQLRKELDQNAATISALESHDKNLRDQLRATEAGIDLKNSSLREAERALVDNAAEFAKLLADLGERSSTVDSQRAELAAVHKQVEAIKLGIADCEHAVKVTEERLARERDDAEAARKGLDETRGKIDGLAARNPELERQLFKQTTEAETLGRRLRELEMRLGDQNRLLAELDFEVDRLRSDIEIARKIRSNLRDVIEQLSNLRRESATMRRDGETSRAALRVETALLHERIIDVAAHIARLIAVLEGTGSPILSLLAVEALSTGNRTSDVKRKSGESGAAMLDLQHAGKSTIADSIRALQSTASRVASN